MKDIMTLMVLLVVVVGMMLVAFTFIGAFYQMKLNTTNSTNYVYNPDKQIETGGSIYTGDGLTVNIQSLDWGTLYPNQNATAKATFTNNFIDPTTLSFAGVWTPPESKEYLQLEWDYDGKPVPGKTSVDLTFTLRVSPDIKGITNFNIEVTVTGTW